MTDRQMDGLPHHLMPPYDGGIIRLRISALGKSEQSTVLPPPQKCLFLWGDLSPHPVHGSLDPNGISVSPAVFAGLTLVSN